MQEFLDIIKSLLTIEKVMILVKIIVVFFLGLLIKKLLRKTAKKITTSRFTKQTVVLTDTIIKYTINIIVILIVLSMLGIKINSILGAAGIAGIAIGFAAQTSISNIISGFFVLGEQTIKIGDYITVDDKSGTVCEITLLAIKVITPDNHLIRIPNETIIKSNLVNSTYFDQRRLTVKTQVSYSTDLKRAFEVLKSVPARCSTVLKDPEPLVYYDGFNTSGIDIVLCVWFKNETLFQTKNEVYMTIKKAFDEAGISIPYNTIDINFNDINLDSKEKEEKEKQKLPEKTSDSF